MLRTRFARVTAVVVGLWILACGRLGDTGIEEPFCEVDCPHGSFEVADNTSADRCTSTCEPLVDCPSWGVPQVTDECYSCTHITESGQLLPLLPNIGYGSLDEGCDQASESSSLLHVLWWVEEDYRIGAGSLGGSAHIVFSSGVDQSVLCDVAYAVTEIPLEPSCTECDVELGAELEFTDYSGEFCESLLTDHRLTFAELANGGSLLLGYAAEWTSWDGRAHEDVVFRYDYDLIYEASEWIPYTHAAEVGAPTRDGTPRSIRTLELWGSEWVQVWRDPYDLYRTTHPAETTMLGLPVSAEGASDLAPTWRLDPGMPPGAVGAARLSEPSRHPFRK